MVNPVEFDYFAASGYYVVNTNDSWVYDVDVYEGNKKIAVVGFTNKQEEGALFWQCDIDILIENNYSPDKILEVAREYRDLYRHMAESENVENFLK
tara:strand:+ start:646 stop:933 length:288 start_codon:yes stop_codon:yes gene_type:complete